MKVPAEDGQQNNTTNERNEIPDTSRTGKVTDRSTNRTTTETLDVNDGTGVTSRPGNTTDISPNNVKTETAGANNIHVPLDTDRSGKTTDRSTKHKKTGRAGAQQKAKQEELSSKGRDRLKRMRRLYQAELVKNLKFFHSARSFIELGSKPLSVKQSKSRI